MEGGLGGGLVVEALRRAPPANLDAAEQIGLGAGHAIKPRRLERRALAEDLGIRQEANGGAALARGRDLLQPGCGLAAGEALPPFMAVAPDADL